MAWRSVWGAELPELTPARLAAGGCLLAVAVHHRGLDQAGRRRRHKSPFLCSWKATAGMYLVLCRGDATPRTAWPRASCVGAVPFEGGGCPAGHTWLRIGRSHHCAPVGYGQGASRRRRASCEGGGDRPSPRGHGGGIHHRHEACSDLRVVINTPSTRGTFLQVGPIFLVLLITAIYACLLVACRPRSAVVCSAGAAELPELTPA